MEKKGTITITFSESVENHTGNQMIGTIAEKGHSYDQLIRCMQKFEEKRPNCCELLHINDLTELGNVKPEPEQAYLLIIRGGLDILLGEYMNKQDMWDELIELEVDKKAFMKGRVVNKIARHNLCFADFSQEPDYENKKGRVYDFKDLPVMEQARNALPLFLEDAKGLFAEENYYYDLTRKEVGIGGHRDAERSRVIAVRLGESMDLKYQWYYKSEPVGKKIVTMLHDGDMYVMSEKAVGTDWKKSSIYTLRHGTHNLF